MSLGVMMATFAWNSSAARLLCFASCGTAGEVTHELYYTIMDVYDGVVRCFMSHVDCYNGLY